MTRIRAISILEWVGMQLVADSGKLPGWNAVRNLWYVASVDRYFNLYANACESAMLESVTHRDSQLPRQLTGTVNRPSPDSEIPEGGAK
jgi:hypothetical protein